MKIFFVKLAKKRIYFVCCFQEGYEVFSYIKISIECVDDESRSRFNYLFHCTFFK